MHDPDRNVTMQPAPQPQPMDTDVFEYLMGEGFVMRKSAAGIPTSVLRTPDPMASVRDEVRELEALLRSQ